MFHPRILSPALHAAIALFALPAAAQTTVPLGTATGGVAIHYNDNGVGESAGNVAYARAQFSLANANGSQFNFDSATLPGTNGVLSWFEIFQSVPDQFGLDLVLEAPTSDATNPTPVLTAYENGNNTLAGRIPAGPVDWAVNGYSGVTVGPFDPANGIINSLFRGGNGSGSSVALTLGAVQQNGSLFTVDFEIELESDDIVHWYGLSSPNHPLFLYGLTGRFLASGSLTYDTQGPGEISTNLIDFYAGTVTIEGEIICGHRYVAPNGNDFPLGIPNLCFQQANPCGEIQRVIEITCPGDTITVAPGLYEQALTIDRSISLVASAPATEANAGDDVVQAIIDGDGAVYAITVTDGVSGARIEGFEITNPTHAGVDTDAAGIRVQSDSPSGATVDIEIVGNVIHDVSSPSRTDAAFGELGILALNVGGGLISGNTIYNLSDSEPPNFVGESPGSGRAQGILVKSSNGTATGVVIEDNVLHDVQDVGIRVNGAGGTSATVRRNRVSVVGRAGLGGLSGIGIDHIGTGFVQENVIGNVIGGLGVGIQANGPSQVTGNRLTDIAGGNSAVPPNFFPGAAVLIVGNGAAVNDNSIEANAIGVLAAPGTSGLVAHQNCIVENDEAGLVNASSAAVNATGNWWGNATGPSGDGPGIGDAVTDAGTGVTTVVPFATEPVCSFAKDLNLLMLRIRPDTGPPSEPNGRIVAKGDLVVDLTEDEIDVSAGVRLRVKDGLGLDTDDLLAPPDWDAADCDTKLHPFGMVLKVKCYTPDRSAKLQLRAVRPFTPGGLQTYKFSALVQDLPLDAPFAGPVSLEVLEGTGVSRTGVIPTCVSGSKGLRCLQN